MPGDPSPPLLSELDPHGEIMLYVQSELIWIAFEQEWISILQDLGSDSHSSSLEVLFKEKSQIWDACARQCKKIWCSHFLGHMSHSWCPSVLSRSGACLSWGHVIWLNLPSCTAVVEPSSFKGMTGKCCLMQSHETMIDCIKLSSMVLQFASEVLALHYCRTENIGNRTLRGFW